MAPAPARSHFHQLLICLSAMHPPGLAAAFSGEISIFSRGLCCLYVVAQSYRTMAVGGLCRGRVGGMSGLGQVPPRCCACDLAVRDNHRGRGLSVWQDLKQPQPHEQPQWPVPHSCLLAGGGPHSRRLQRVLLDCASAGQVVSGQRHGNAVERHPRSSMV
ncbi:hypothetical protein LY76DRAFT_340877 [Colletotrichum caudatum]|nr:hypothetical protein LY76DRAFT_340877 [Colletotrichum caudatum]